MTDLVGPIIRFSGTRYFKGKSRLIRLWMDRRDRRKTVIRILPGGARIRCDLSVPYEAMVYLKQEEEAELRALRRLLCLGDTFVDCGANVGVWSLVAASLVGGTGVVHAFEPNPRTFEKLAQNVKELNHFSATVRLHQAAVGSATGQVDFLALDAHNVSSIANRAFEGTIRVPIATLDQMLNGKRLNGIKIDVEGYELKVLRGADGLLERWKPWLCVEFNTELARVNSLSDWEVHHFLRERGFRPCLAQYVERGIRQHLPDTWKAKGYVNLFYFNDRNT